MDEFTDLAEHAQGRLGGCFELLPATALETDGAGRRPSHDRSGHRVGSLEGRMPWGTPGQITDRCMGQRQSSIVGSRSDDKTVVSPLTRPSPDRIRGQFEGRGSIEMSLK